MSTNHTMSSGSSPREIASISDDEPASTGPNPTLSAEQLKEIELLNSTITRMEEFDARLDAAFEEECVKFQTLWDAVVLVFATLPGAHRKGGADGDTPSAEQASDEPRRIKEEFERLTDKLIETRKQNSSHIAAQVRRAINTLLVGPQQKIGTWWRFTRRLLQHRDKFTWKLEEYSALAAGLRLKLSATANAAVNPICDNRNQSSSTNTSRSLSSDPAAKLIGNSYQSPTVTGFPVPPATANTFSNTTVVPIMPIYPQPAGSQPAFPAAPMVPSSYVPAPGTAVWSTQSVPMGGGNINPPPSGISYVPLAPSMVVIDPAVTYENQQTQMCMYIR